MISEHEMLVTVATMALKMSDLCGHDIVESMRALGYGHVLDEARGTSVVKCRPTTVRPYASRNISCPYCSARPGESCVSLNGKQIGYTHRARLDAVK